MRFIPLAMVGLLVATAAGAQTPPPPRAPDGPAAQSGIIPPPPPPPRDGPDAPPPPPGGPRGPRGDRPPPPPPTGVGIHVEKGADGLVRVDVRCAEQDSTKDCADIAIRLLDRIGDTARSK